MSIITRRIGKDRASKLFPDQTWPNAGDRWIGLPLERAVANAKQREHSGRFWNVILGLTTQVMLVGFVLFLLGAIIAMYGALSFYVPLWLSLMWQSDNMPETLGQVLRWMLTSVFLLRFASNVVKAFR